MDNNFSAPRIGIWFVLLLTLACAHFSICYEEGIALAFGIPRHFVKFRWESFAEAFFGVNFVFVSLLTYLTTVTEQRWRRVGVVLGLFCGGVAFIEGVVDGFVSGFDWVALSKYWCWAFLAFAVTIYLFHAKSRRWSNILLKDALPTLAGINGLISAAIVGVLFVFSVGKFGMFCGYLSARTQDRFFAMNEPPLDCLKSVAETSELNKRTGVENRCLLLRSYGNFGVVAKMDGQHKLESLYFTVPLDQHAVSWQLVEAGPFWTPLYLAKERPK